MQGLGGGVPARDPICFPSFGIVPPPPLNKKRMTRDNYLMVAALTPQR